MITKHQGKFAISTCRPDKKFALFGPENLGVDNLDLYDLHHLDVLVRTVLHDEYAELLYNLERPMYRYAAAGTGWYGDDRYCDGPGWRRFCAERERLEKLVKDTDPHPYKAPPPTYNWLQWWVKKLFRV